MGLTPQIHRMRNDSLHKQLGLPRLWKLCYVGVILQSKDSKADAQRVTDKLRMVCDRIKRIQSIVISCASDVRVHCRRRLHLGLPRGAAAGGARRGLRGAAGRGRGRVGAAGARGRHAALAAALARHRAALQRSVRPPVPPQRQEVHLLLRLGLPRHRRLPVQRLPLGGESRSANVLYVRDGGSSVYYSDCN